MAGHDAPVELEVVNDDFVVTPAMARILVKLARGRLEAEAKTANGSRTKKEDAGREA